MRVLVADDDPVACEFVAAVARNAGHTVAVARDAMQVMHMAANQSPDLIILDIMMPAGTGVGALQKLRALAKTAAIPVIVLSGVKDEAVIARVRELGVSEFLSKPVSPEALAAAISSVAGSADG